MEHEALVYPWSHEEAGGRSNALLFPARHPETWRSSPPGSPCPQPRTAPRTLCRRRDACGRGVGRETSCCSPLGCVLGVSENAAEQSVEEEKDWGSVRLVKTVSVAAHRRNGSADATPTPWACNLGAGVRAALSRGTGASVLRGRPRPGVGSADRARERVDRCTTRGSGTRQGELSCDPRVGAGFGGWSER